MTESMGCAEVNGRDQDASSFTRILSELARAIGASAVALVDFEGETVDYAGDVDPYEIRLAAAHWQVVLSSLKVFALGPVVQLTVGTSRRSVIVRRQPDGYAIVAMLSIEQSFFASVRAFQKFEAALAREAGWELPMVSNVVWNQVRVEEELDRQRPVQLCANDTWQSLEIIGTFGGTASGEKGYRVRMSDGIEISLIRDGNGAWSTDAVHLNFK